MDREPIMGYNRLMKYNWQQSDWPHFRYELENIHEILFSIAEKMGRASGQLSNLPLDLQTEVMINLMVEEAIKSSGIEGEYINRPDVRSSIKNKLGLNPKPVKIQDRRAQGIADLMLDVRKTFSQPLTAKKLCEWHLMLSGSISPNLLIGRWRIDEEPMQVVSGHDGKYIVHYEAPLARDVPKEMKRFIQWFNNTAPDKPQAIKFAPVRAAIAHLYFESIHPFDDGNGRIGRAIAEKALSQSFGYPIVLSLSQAIEATKKAYYDALKKASRSNEITAWIQYFVNIILSAQINAETNINFTLQKAKFFDRFTDKLNNRQLKVIHRMMRDGVQSFEGGMSAKKYMTITGTSKATSTRDLQNLLAMHAFKQIGSGRSVRYDLDL